MWVKAIAMGNNYETSDVLTKTYTVSTLEQLNASNNENLKKHATPCMDFNGKVWKGLNSNSISLYNKSGTRINGDVIMMEKKILFVPQDNLTENSYIFNLPSQSITDIYGIANVEKITCDLNVNANGSEVDTVVIGRGPSFYYITRDGSLYSFGNNDYGQLGDGTKTDRTIPHKIMTDVKTVIAGDYQHVFAIKRDGTLWAWGSNGNCGVLGDGTRTDRLYPVKVMDDVKMVRSCNIRTVNPEI